MAAFIKYPVNVDCGRRSRPKQGDWLANPTTSPYRLRFMTHPAEQPQSTSTETIDLSDSTVLIVDDNAQNLELLVAYLEPMGCQMATATDGLEALSFVDNQQPDLILLDVMMPKMSGFEVCKKLKGDPATRTIPIIMVTALNELGDVERGVESGTDDFLSKPVNKLELQTRVKSLLRVGHLKRQLDRASEQIEQAKEDDDT
jgi:two-component system alkaline phosphatase synthesis response regulator PhoP